MAKSFLASATIFTTSAATTVGLLHAWDIGLFGYGIVTTVKNMHDEGNIKKLSAGDEDFLPKWGKETLCYIFNKKMNEDWKVNNEEVEGGHFSDMLKAIKNVCQDIDNLENEKETLKNIIYGIRDMQEEEVPEERSNYKFTFPRPTKNT